MKLLVATDVTVRGGVDHHVRSLVGALRAAGHGVRLAVEATTASALGEPGTGAALGVEVHREALYHRRHQPAELEGAADRLLAATAAQGLHVVCGSPRSCLVLRERAALAGVPVIVTEQQVDAALRLDTDMAARVRRSYRDALAVVFVSKGNLGTMDEVVGLDGVRTVLAPNGVDVEAIRRRVAAVPARRRSRRPIRALALARYAPEKGLDILVRATALLPSDVLEVADCHGEGPERDRLVGLAAALGVSERVAFLPWCSDVPERLTGHDVLVLPSRSEGMPYAVLEAMAAGTPVVATDVHGTAEALDGGRCGLLVRQDDPEALAAALVDVHRDPDAAARRAAAAVDRVSRHDERRQLTTIVSLWDDVDSDGRDERGEGLRDRHRRVPG